MAENWSSMQERGSYWGVQFFAVAYRLLGRGVCLFFLAPAITFFYFAGARQRRASQDYLERVWRAGYLPKKPGLWEGLKHYMAFGESMIDKLAAWIGDIRPQDVDGVHDGLFHEAKLNPRGGFVITAHIGNPEVIRAVATVSRRFVVNVIMHTAHAEQFNRLIERISPDSTVRLIQVTTIDMPTAMRLSEAVGRGEWVILTGDRLPAHGDAGRSVSADLLGAPALFPEGPYFLGAVLKCPTYLLFCTRRKDRFGVRISLLDDPLQVPRKDRERALGAYARRFAAALEAEIAATPFQWFNFYDLWGTASGVPEKADEQSS
ncbi:MAG: lipid A biosynthesis acyltransferase [Alphaproteobacteria bacterium]|nr:lipid A biosynthesis acyltransferase [Alphaproteobacteria bacterium]